MKHRYALPDSQRAQSLTPIVEQGIVLNDECSDPISNERREHGLKIRFFAGVQDANLLANRVRSFLHVYRPDVGVWAVSVEEEANHTYVRKELAC